MVTGLKISYQTVKNRFSFLDSACFSFMCKNHVFSCWFQSQVRTGSHLHFNVLPGKANEEEMSS